MKASQLSVVERLFLRRIVELQFEQDGIGKSSRDLLRNFCMCPVPVERACFDGKLGSRVCKPGVLKHAHIDFRYLFQSS